MKRVTRSLYLLTFIVIVLFALVLAFSATSAVAQDEPASENDPAQAGDRGRQVAEDAARLRQDSGGAGRKALTRLSQSQSANFPTAFRWRMSTSKLSRSYRA